MLNAIQAGILTSSTKERLEQLEETKREFETRIAEEKLAKPKIKEEFIRFWLLRFRKLDMSLKDQRQALVDTFINSIYLYDDKVLITFNYKEGTQTITFEEAAQAASKGNGSDLDCFAAPRKTRTRLCSGFSFCQHDGRGSNRAAARSAASNQPSGLLLSARVPRVRNVYGDRQPLMTSSSGLRSFFILRRRGVEQHVRPTVRTMIWTNNPLDESGRCLCFTETTA